MKQFKKLAMLMAGLWCCIAVNAHDFQRNGIYYNILTTKSVEVTFKGSSYFEYSDEYAGKVEIPESVTYNGKTYSVTSIGQSAFFTCSGLTSITIPNSVKTIGEWAFRDCKGITSIAIPNSVTSIGEYAFQYCTGLTSITIPNSVTSIGQSAFYGCEGLKTVINCSSLDISAGYSDHGFVAYYADKVITADRQIGDFIFYQTALVGYVGSQSELVLPEDYNGKKYMIGPSAFEDNTNLTSVFIPASVTSIGDWAFSGCTGLASITIPNSVTSIGRTAFHGCTGLTSITIPNSVTSIGDWAFSNCTRLASITIPNSVKTIGEWAFRDCKGITSIAIPNSVTSIGEYAFQYCTGLTSITIPNSVTSIGQSAFYGCEGLKTVINCSSLDISAGYSDHGFVAYYADKVITADRQIGDFFFYNTELARYVGNKSELALPEDYNGEKYMIGDGAFRDNTHLTSVFIPASVTGIEENAFNGCGNLASLTMASPVPPASVYENSFGTINYIYTTLYVPEGSLAAYQTADVWKYFMKIKEYDPTGIEDVVLDTESSNLPIYNQQGVRMKDVDSLPSGIYIQGGKKFVVK